VPFVNCLGQTVRQRRFDREPSSQRSCITRVRGLMKNVSA